MTEALTPFKARATLLGNNLGNIKSVLPEGMDAARLCRMAMNAVNTNSALLKCDPNSLLLAVINCAETGLELVLGQAALVPRAGKVCFEVMYGGLITLAHNTGFTIHANVVREGDEFEYEEGTSAFIKHKPVFDSKEPLKYAYAIAHCRIGGPPVFVVMDRLQVLKRKAFSKASRADSPWKQWEDEQWKKTAIKALAKHMPKSPRFQRAVMLDNLAAAGKAQNPMVQLDGVTVELDDPDEGPDDAPPDARPWDPESGEAAPGERPQGSGKDDGLGEIM